MPELGLKKSELSAIIKVLESNLSILAASVFGSRASGTCSTYSDIDIAVYGNLDSSDVESIIYDLDELPLIYKFDVVAYGQIKSHTLRKHIDSVGIMVYEKGKVCDVYSNSI
ncbi:MAG: nucleotidyltransferase domain-containing protein [Holophagales bacterium]|jgi:predicted nucleotidyltransferase|nr:nucleotidyltransferase domain-containing protein [Holophagales bacterium]